MHGPARAAGLVRDAGKLRAHPHPRQCGYNGEIVGVPQMADEEHLACKFRQAGTQRRIEMLEHQLLNLRRRKVSSGSRRRVSAMAVRRAGNIEILPATRRDDAIPL